MSDAPARTPLLVTGAHRSGSTWLGLVLVRAPGTIYLNEPFHPNHTRGHCGADFGCWFRYVCDANAAEYRPALERMLRLTYDHGAERRGPAPARIGRRLRDWWYFTRHRLRGDLPVMKDPLAFFSTEWLARALGMRPVVLVRHPAAFASSLKRAGWDFDFENLLGQPLLMRDLLGPLEDELRAATRRGRDLIGDAILLWKAIYGTAATWRERYPDWVFVRHEDLSLDPLGAFPPLFEALGLEFGPAARAYVGETTSATNPGEVAGTALHEHRRDSRANVTNWKQRLEPDEIARVREALAGPAEPFYAPASDGAPGDW
jgi:hypothetical protein